MKCQDYQKVIGLTDPSKIQSLKQVCLSLAQQWKPEEVSPFTQLIKGLIQNFSRNILVSFQKKACVCDACKTTLEEEAMPVFPGET